MSLKLDMSMKLNMKIPRWSETFQKKSVSKRAFSKSDTSVGFYYILGMSSEKKFKALIKLHALNYQQASLLLSERETLHFFGKRGPVWIQRPCFSPKKGLNHQGLFNDSSYVQAREAAGALVGVLRALQLKTLHLEFCNASLDEERGCIVGLELGAYQFRSVYEGRGLAEGLPTVFMTSDRKALNERLKEAQQLAFAVNYARHLVNLPGMDLHPESFASLAQEHFRDSTQVVVSVWDEDRLLQEGMGLHVAVGRGAYYGPRLVHLKYRPAGSKKKPLAFVGKGVTFDSGGLDIKPSSGMRHMKKDMGGAAALFALCVWLNESCLDVPCDFYLPLAENSVGPQSFRPGDILKSRKGLTVEIHNTDAEGRLLLADALDVAINAQDKPELVIDVATLTGAIKGALGADVPGLFSNDDSLAEELQKASHQMGETCWRMPLVPKYISQMNSSVAHLTNAVDGFGGAITAALFLERFVGEFPWAHLDIYAWNDKPTGGLSFVGGSGQSVQTLIEFLQARRTPRAQRPKSRPRVTTL